MRKEDFTLKEEITEFCISILIQLLPFVIILLLALIFGTPMEEQNEIPDKCACCGYSEE